MISLNHPTHVRLVEMSHAIKTETGGRVDITILGNNVLGNDPAMLSHVRSGAIQFISMQGLNYSSVVSSAMLEGVAFAFKSSEQAVRAFEGDFGDVVRSGLGAKGLHGLRPVFSIGFRDITSGTRPIRNVGDRLTFIGDVDTVLMRRALGPYCARWEAVFGPTSWALLEKYTGPLS